MTLTTHALVGAAAAAVLPQHPLLAFVAGFVSHFVADTIPHKDYDELFKSYRPAVDKLKNDFEINKDFWRDLAIIAGDGLLGLILALAFFAVLVPASPLIVLLGALGGQIPDALQFLYFKTRAELMVPLQRFHIWIQQTSPIVVPLWVALGLQGALVVFMFAAVYAIYLVI